MRVLQRTPCPAPRFSQISASSGAEVQAETRDLQKISLRSRGPPELSENLAQDENLSGISAAVNS